MLLRSMLITGWAAGKAPIMGDRGDSQKPLWGHGRVGGGAVLSSNEMRLERFVGAGIMDTVRSEARLTLQTT